MKQVLAFGDSNTWGLVPASAGERYPADVRWTGRLQKELESREIRILEDGVCGRTTVYEDPVRPGLRGIDDIARYAGTENLDAVILMLGTNDCKAAFHTAPEEIGSGLEQCLDRFEKMVPPERILVCSPLRLGEDVWRPDKDPAFNRQSVQVCEALRETYRAIAARRGNGFLAASDYAAASPVDEEHMDPEGHARFAAAVREMEEGGYGLVQGNARYLENGQIRRRKRRRRLTWRRNAGNTAYRPPWSRLTYGRRRSAKRC